MRTSGILLTLGIAAMAMTPAHASVSVDQDAGVCVVDTQETVDFWDELTRDAVEKRLAELGDLGATIAAYDAGAEDNPGELQLRLAETGATEGLGMLTPQRNAAADAELTPDAKANTSRYTADEARSAAARIDDDPAALARQALAGQAESGVRLYEIQQDIFEDRAAEYNELQLATREALKECADELDGPSWGLIIVGGIAVLGLLILGITAVLNSRKPTRHGRSS
ncbi:hypothetical protein [Corynebacterium renale]|uniref:Secreted protein n=1 Tax=Corynebacterium renale TaxID=1724 RepID=A0A2A9DMF1_9CORY|nr:hypothetical protein [Corynebacterium renale]PFG27142.1 hypothetical protein ATK06_0191 [Corynebacterium renale]SQI24032.1 hypothetical membrane protein [Corynebacterium renale]